MLVPVTTTIEPNTWRWWTFLRAASVLNFVLLGLTAALAWPIKQSAGIHLACATIYTIVCAFRSFCPRVDLERTVLIDHPLSSIALGRTSATIAEMAFTVQMSLFAVSLGTGLEALAWSLVPLIALAQTACWTAVVTLDHRWHAMEELLWGAAMVILAVIFARALPGEGIYRWLLPLGLVGCGLGAFVMLILDVPMYFKRHAAEKEKGTRFLPIGEGIRDAISRREPTGAWETWKHEVAWMTPYFSACVWLSIAAVWL